MRPSPHLGQEQGSSCPCPPPWPEHFSLLQPGKTACLIRPVGTFPACPSWPSLSLSPALRPPLCALADPPPWVLSHPPVPAQTWPSGALPLCGAAVMPGTQQQGCPRAEGQGCGGARSPPGPLLSTGRGGRCSCNVGLLRDAFLQQMERVRQWEIRLLQDIEEATQHELTIEDD